MKIKTLKILTILAAAFFVITAFIESLWLFAMPKFVNKKLEAKILTQLVFEKTNLDLNYEKAYIKTKPNFSLLVFVNNAKLNDKNHPKIIELRTLKTTIGLPDLLLKNINIKNTEIEGLYITFKRNKNGKIYFGNFEFPQINLKEFDKFEYNLNKLTAKTQDTQIIFDDQLTKQFIKLKIDKFDIDKYEKDKHINIYIKSTIDVNSKDAIIDLTAASKLPINKGIGRKDFKLNGYIKNINLSNYSEYIKYFSKQNIVKSTGIINADFSSQKDISVNATLEDFAINMKNPLDSIKSDDTVNFQAQILPKAKDLKIKQLIIKTNKWETDISGSLKNYKSKNPDVDLDINIPDSDIHSMYWLVPSIEGDPQDVMQKFKKYGAWGKAKGNIKIKGSINNPEVYGKLEAYDVYIVKNNPLVKHCKIFAEFLKDKVKIKTRVFAGHGEYVDVDGIAEMKINGAGEFHVKSSPNVDLSTAEYMLVPVHEVIGFDLGPVPYMDITGKGDIEITTKGTILDGEVIGAFHFRNTNATLEGLNTKIEKAYGTLDFDRKNMHFYTKQAFIKNKPVKIDGKANLNGDIDFEVTSKTIDSKELLNILKTSPMLKDKKDMVAPIESLSGQANTLIKIKGIVKDFKEVIENPKLNISGKLILKNNESKLTFSPIIAKKISGIIEFEDNDWNADINGYIGTSNFKANGYSKKNKTYFKAKADSIKTDELLESLNISDKIKINSLPKTNSLISFNGEYTSHSKDFDPKNLKANGYFKPLNENINTPFEIKSGKFQIEKGNAELSNFKATLYNSNIYLNGNAENIFSNDPILSYAFDASKFDISSFNALKNVQFLPSYIKNILNAYENYEGIANISIKCKKNKSKGYITLKDVKFNHSYFKTPIAINSGNIQILNEKILLKSLIAQVDNTPMFINAAVWDLDKTMHFSGYFTTKITDYFVNKYINTRLTYPIKPKGDITLTTDVNGSIDNITIKPKIKLAQDADIYYMGSNLSNEDNIRELKAVINIKNNKYILKNAEYIRYMTSQNDKIYPLTILKANGIFNIHKKDIYIENLKIKTENSANAKIFNAIFKKSILKNGMFNCDLNVKGSLKTPKINGIVTLNNLDMPLYQTVIKNGEIKFSDKYTNLMLDINSYDSDFIVNSLIQNKYQPPYIVENINIHSNKVNLDSVVDSLTKIPTPNTVIKMSEHGIPSKNQINISDIQIKQGNMTADNIIIRGLPASNYKANFTLGKDIVLKINNLAFDITTGKIQGIASYNFVNDQIKAELKANNVDSNKVASALFDFKDQIFGKSNGTIIMTTKGNSDTERIRNLSGHVYFDISDGRMPKLGSVEYLLKAGNLIKSGITGVSLNNFIDLIAPIKTGYFDSIKGKFAIKNGVAQDIEVYSKGDNLNLYINGEYDILQQYANMRIYGRLTKKANNILGAVGNLSFNSILNAIPGFKLDRNAKLKIIKDLNKIPGVELSDQQYRVFTVKVDGKINEEKYVRSFRWIE